MCYRKSFVAGQTDQVHTGECPSCGMPVAASIGIDSGICPHCGKPIPKGTESQIGINNDDKGNPII